MSSGRIVPPISDTHGVADPVARQVLTEIREVLQVREGNKGNGDAKFLTKADLRNLVGDENYDVLTEDGKDPDTVKPRPNGQRRPSVSNIIRDLQREIGGSPLSVFLSQRIEAVRKPIGGLIERVGQSETRIANEIVSRVSADAAILTETRTNWTQTGQSIAVIQSQLTTATTSFSALATQVNTIQARLDDTGNSVSIEQRFATLVTRDELSAQYTVKIDLNGYVTGFGLYSSSTGGTPTSLFLVRADRFAIGAPGLNDQIPFIVTTTERFVGGRRQPPGVYMDAAFVTNLTVDSADILDAAVDTLRIKGNAVTIPSSASNPNRVLMGGSQVLLASITVVYDFRPQRVLIAFSFNALARNAAGEDEIQARIRRNGVEIYGGGISVVSAYSTYFSATLTDNPSAGNVTYELFAFTTRNRNNLDAANATISAIATLR
jgi:Domain of unknown function (DUF1983)